MIVFIGKFPWTSGTTLYSCLLLFFFFFFSMTSCTIAEYDSRDAASISNDRTRENDFRSCNEGKCTKRTTQEMSSGMWFGPRLGKRRKFEGKTDNDKDAELEALANAFDGTAGLAIVALPGEKVRRTGNRVKSEQEGDYDENELTPKYFLLSRNSDNARDDGTFSSEPFSLAIDRGNRRVPSALSSRFPRRSRVSTF